MRLQALILSSLLMAASTHPLLAQDRMTPELLWKLGRISPEVLTPDGQVIYKITHYNTAKNKSKSLLRSQSIFNGKAEKLFDTVKTVGDFQLLKEGKLGFSKEGQWWEMNPDGTEKSRKTDLKEPMENIKMSPNKDYLLFSRKVKLKKVFGKDFYKDVPKSQVQIYTDLMYRHWDQWFDGQFSHVFYATYDEETGKVGRPIDIMEGEPYSSPQAPFGGTEDVIWSPDGSKIIYVSKKKFGKEDALSTNTDLYEYDLKSGKTINLTSSNKGYDTQPVFRADGKLLAWCSMKTDGYESDKNDLLLMDPKSKQSLNLTAHWDGTVNSFKWSQDGQSIYFTAPIEGTIQLFSVSIPQKISSRKTAEVTQLTKGDFDITDIVGQQEATLVLGRQDMNHATELYTFDLSSGALSQLTHVNDSIYKKLKMGKIEKRWVTTTDKKKELVWLIYPPDFDSTKQYPTLLYCQGGPQGEVSQFYSFRWNFQLMAAHGYIIVAPNRRGLPGFGVEWNEVISKDWGGQPMKDYLSAIDSIAELSYVDKNRLGCIGASYGGYSVYMLAGMHENRFKSFIAHDGLFDLRSWYGTTEELWFANWDIGGAYWDQSNQAAQKSYEKFSPSDYVDRWNTPILIVQGGVDFRVPIEQGLQAFQAAQLQGIKSKLLYFPEENHWVLQPQDALVWQREFFKWLEETL